MPAAAFTRLDGDDAGVVDAHSGQPALRWAVPPAGSNSGQAAGDEPADMPFLGIAVVVPPRATVSAPGRSRLRVVDRGRRVDIALCTSAEGAHVRRLTAVGAVTADLYIGLGYPIQSPTCR